jgi:hypothetical protein
MRAPPACEYRGTGAADRQAPASLAEQTVTAGLVSVSVFGRYFHGH